METVKITPQSGVHKYVNVRYVSQAYSHVMAVIATDHELEL